MKLDAEQLLKPLDQLLNRIGAKKIVWSPDSIVLPDPEFDIYVNPEDDPEINEELFNGPSEYFTYRGKQCLLYIPTPYNVYYDDNPHPTPEKLYKFHFMNCRTINQMYRNRRIERYIITNKTTGIFRVNLRTNRFSDKFIEIHAKLFVCKNCLKEWNYLDYEKATPQERDRIVQQFNIKQFFYSCNPDFDTLPSRTDDDPLPKDIYPSNWNDITNRYREQKKWRCEGCGVDLSSHHEYLDTHHINGNKSDNRKYNLQALCRLCHAEQPLHEHMIVKHEAKRIIELLRADMERAMRNFAAL